MLQTSPRAALQGACEFNSLTPGAVSMKGFMTTTVTVFIMLPASLDWSEAQRSRRVRPSVRLLPVL